MKGPTSVAKQETQKVTEDNEQVSVSKRIESVNACWVHNFYGRRNRGRTP